MFGGALQESQVVAPPCSHDDVIAMIGEVERMRAAIAIGVHDMEDAGQLPADGAVNTAAWLRHNCRLSSEDAHWYVRRGRKLALSSELESAAATGELSEGQINAVCAVLTHENREIFNTDTEQFIDAIRDSDVEDTREFCQTWKQTVDAILNKKPPSEEGRYYGHKRLDGGGPLLGRFELHGDAATNLQKAIDLATTWNGNDDTRTPGQRRADALGEIAAFYNANHEGEGTPRHRPHVDFVMHADEMGSTLPVAHTIDGELVPAASVRMFLCDCVLHRVSLTPDARLSYGREMRTVPKDLFRVLALKDQGCRYLSCDRGVRHCDAHHINKHWADGGLTEEENLALFCNRHHHQVHQPGWDAKMLPDRTIHITMPSGKVLISRPPPPL